MKVKPLYRAGAICLYLPMDVLAKKAIAKLPNYGRGTMSRTTVMFRTIQLPSPAIWLTFAVPAPRMERTAGVAVSTKITPLAHSPHPPARSGV